MLDLQQCRGRQKRLIGVLQSRKLDAILCAAPHHVYWLTGHRPLRMHQSAAVLLADGRLWLSTANTPASNVAADEVVGYPAQWMSTLRQEQPEVVAEQVVGLLQHRRVTRLGADTSPMTGHVSLGFNGGLQSIEPDMWQLRRRKDADELALIEKAMRCSEAMYARARQIIEPGISELRVFSELHDAAVQAAGEPMSAMLGNDFACNARGGPPRADHRAGDGELYILDLSPTYRGYFADNARTFAVNRKPTDEQIAACNAVKECLKIVEKLARPGVKCREIFAAVDEHLKQSRGTGMPHHLGHGIGLQGHEYPHLNPHWDDTLMEGEVFAAEPGQYAPELKAGVRLENNYIVTADGVRPILDFPLDL